eukprot:7558517-Pyramimonas_sp.AAC.1
MVEWLNKGLMAVWSPTGGQKQRHYHSALGLDMHTVELTVNTLSSGPITLERIQFSRQFFTDATCPCLAPSLSLPAKSRCSFAALSTYRGWENQPRSVARNSAIDSLQTVAGHARDDKHAPANTPVNNDDAIQ